jgi:MOSC domain-containing protein YiiM
MSSAAVSGQVRQILISPKKGDPMLSKEEMHALAGRGLAGDRNFSPRAAGKTNNLTLIESEKIDGFVAATSLEFSAEDSRRNIVTSGIDLNLLVGREFYLGTVKVKALELCEPCSLLAKRTHRAVLWGLRNKGGLRCEIITDGIIRVGDEIRPAATNE